MTDTPTVEQRHAEAGNALWMEITGDWPKNLIEEDALTLGVFRKAFARFEALLTQQPRPDASVDGLAGELAEMITEVEQDRIDDANAAEDAGERPDLWGYEVCLDLDKAKAILAALTTRERGTVAYDPEQLGAERN